MKLRLLALAAAVATALAASSASAAVTSAFFDPLAWGLKGGEVDITQFEGGPTLAGVTFNQPGYSLSGTGELFIGSVGNISAAPAVPVTAGVYDPATGRDGSQYLSIQGGQSVTMTLADLSEISLYIGSLDGYNKLSFHYADGTTEALMSGQWVSDNTISQSNGDRQNGNSNGRLTLTFDKPVTSVVLSSDTNAFEISDIAGGVPEPASWALMILGFGGAGALARGRRRRQPAVATA
ncbi:MAG TPA: PEPxxWA-CTERM sorting domain-containing protein [Phenylobacterium sp.]|jgi:hypothetical protein|uniref:Npun_F0296 family exosortase-dependent surface protein n=1 Tax=Phenylobacterium sp. TaxID=1871053 RepID=UPI002B521E43|nr:PEPxxWA-CTERM sorting domain-containing protein [Phenylobacterium sp.]HXA38977.1 PEPxxWA-CTERM sorting domain-containing protein [Phenylobacterium sp.]